MIKKETQQLFSLLDGWPLREMNKKLASGFYIIILEMI